VALPGDLNTATITGTYLDPSGAPLAGTITFTPSSQLADSTGSTVIPSYGKTYNLSAAGHFQTDPLVATDNSDIAPSGWSYLVTVAIQNLQPITFSVLVPHTPSPVDISALMPVVASGTIGDFLPELVANVSVSASGTLALNTVTEVSASSASRTMTLPTAGAGDLVVVEKSDSSVNTVAVTGTIRGSSGSITLKLQNESEMLYGWAGSWWPVAGHKTLGSLDARYVQGTGGKMTGPFVTQVPVIVFDGDSITFGIGALPVNRFPNSNDYPSQVVGSLDQRGTYVNIGVAGETTATMITNAPTAVDPYFTAGCNNVVCFHGGTNDIQFGADAPTTYGRIVTYCQARQAAGWRVIVATITPRSDAGTPGNFETIRQSVNTSIRTNWQTFANGLADIGNDANMGQASDQTNTQYYNGDLVHHNPYGYGILASYFQQALSTLGIVSSFARDREVLHSDIWIPAGAFQAASGTPTAAVTGQMPVWNLAHGASTEMCAQGVLLPQNWLQWGAEVWWAPSTTGAGNVVWRVDSLPVFTASTLNSGVVVGTALASAATGTTGLMQVLTSAASANANIGGAPRTLLALRVWRLGSSGSDTYADAASFVGLRVWRSI
jgi:lysophospholipase L1-like esterase